MKSGLVRWFMSWSIRWKLQFGFFTVTMFTIIFNRWLAINELDRFIAIVSSNGAAQALVQQLEANRSTYIQDAVWESALELIILFAIISVLSVFFVKPIKALCSALEAMQKGDLTKEVAVTNLDEIGDLERHFNGMLTKLNSLMHSINDSSKNIGQSAYQIATVSHEIAEVSQAQRDSSSEVTSATDRLHEVSDRVKELAIAATERAEKTEQSASNGISIVRANIAEMERTVEEVNQASAQISELEQAAQDIHNFVSAITSIAEQTNLLALNAAIEAARAGDQGRGFAVVADEVRNLATGTSDSAGQISEIVGTLSNKVQQVTATMARVVDEVQGNQRKAGETSQVIEKMTEDVLETSATNREISEVSEEQLERLEFLRSKMDWLFTNLDKSASKVETTENIGSSLFESAEMLNQLIAGFQFEQDKRLTPSENEKRAYPRLQNSLLVRVEQDGAIAEGISLDCSLSGIQLKLTKKIRETYPISLDVRLPYNDVEQYEKQRPVRLSGRIAWTDEKGGHYYYGIKFDQLNTTQRAQLKKIFEFFKANPEF